MAMNLFSSLVIALLSPALWLLFMVLGAAAAWRLGARRWARRLVGTALVLTMVLALVPVGPWLTKPLEDRFPQPDPMPATIDGMVVLGGAIDPVRSVERGSVALNANAERLVAFVALARRYPSARLVFTGGTGDPFEQDYKEADGARALLAALGLEPARVTFERESRNTYENAVYAFRRVRPKQGEVWLLITSARHMPRAMGSFRNAGWPRLVAYPVDYRTDAEYAVWMGLDLLGGIASLEDALREWVGLAGYALLGRTGALFPGPESAP